MERLSSIDCGKTVAMFLIVAIHTHPFLGTMVAGYDLSFLRDIINSYARFAVPFFFLFFGYWMFAKYGFSSGKNEENKNDFKAAILRILKLYVIWVLLYFFADCLIAFVDGFVSGVSNDAVFSKIKNTYISPLLVYYGPHHLWFLISLVFSALIVRFVSKLRFFKVDFVLLLLFLSAALHFLGLFGESYSVFSEFPLQTRDTLFFGLFYATLGYVIARRFHGRDLSRFTLLFFGLFVLFSLAQVFEAIVLLNFFDARLGDYYLTSAPAATFFLLWLLSAPDIGRLSWIESCGVFTLGIYLLHPLIIKLTYAAYDWGDSVPPTDHILWALVFTPFVFLTSYMITRRYSGIWLFKP